MGNASCDVDLEGEVPASVAGAGGGHVAMVPPGARPLVVLNVLRKVEERLAEAGGGR